MTSKRKLRERIEKLEDTIAIMREFDRVMGQPSTSFTPLERVYVPPHMSASTTLAPWCASCRGFHLPGSGPCTGTYTWQSRSTADLS